MLITPEEPTENKSYVINLLVTLAEITNTMSGNFGFFCGNGKTQSE